MSENKKYYSQDRFMGVPIKCDDSYPSLTKILEALYVMVYGCTKAYTRQRGCHVRLRFTEKMDSRKFSACFSTFFERKSGYTPMRLRVAERDKDEDGLHHHFAIILNDKFDRIYSLNRFMAELFKGGFLADYEVIPPRSDPCGHHLQTLEEKDSYFEWVSYLAKVYTKAKSGQVWSSCRTVSRALKEWEFAGKPDLRKKLLDRHQTDIGLSVDISDFMQLIDVSAVTTMPLATSNVRYVVPCTGTQGVCSG